MVIQLLTNGLVAGCVYGLTALGFGLIYSTTRIFHFAHGAIFTASAYAAYFLIIVLGWHYAAGVLCSLLVAVLMGIAIEKIVYSPLLDKVARLEVLLISSMGVYIVIVNLLALMFGNEPKLLRPGIEKTIEAGNLVLTQIQIVEIAVFLVVSVLIYFFLKTTLHGKAIRGLSDNPALVTALGIDITRMRIFIFALGSLLAGLAGILTAMDVGIDPLMGLSALLTGAVAVIVGGVRVLKGGAVGALLVGVTQHFLIWKISARWQEAITLLILIIFLIWRPQGLLGEKARIEEI